MIDFIKLQCVDYPNGYYVICDVKTGQIYTEKTFFEKFKKQFHQITTSNVNMFTISTSEETRQVEVRTYYRSDSCQKPEKR